MNLRLLVSLSGVAMFVAGCALQPYHLRPMALLLCLLGAFLVLVPHLTRVKS